MEDYSAKGEKMSSRRGAQMMSSLPPLSWFTKLADMEWPSSRPEEAPELSGNSMGQAFIPITRPYGPNYVHVNSQTILTPRPQKPIGYSQFNFQQRPRTDAYKVRSMHGMPQIVKTPQIVVINRPKSTMACPQQLMQGKHQNHQVWDRVPYGHEQMYSSNMPFFMVPTEQDKKKFHSHAIQVHDLDNNTSNYTSTPLDLRRRSPNSQQQRLKTFLDNQMQSSKGPMERQVTSTSQMQQKNLQLRPLISGLRPLMPLNPSHGASSQSSQMNHHETVNISRMSASQNLKIRSSDGIYTASRPSLHHIVGRPQTTQELQCLQSPNSWSKHPRLMMDNLVSQSVPSVTKRKDQTVPHKPSMSEVPQRSGIKTKPQEEQVPLLAPKPWLPAKFPFAATFTTTITTAQRPFPVVVVPADSSITGRVVHRVRTGTAVSCAHLGTPRMSYNIMKPYPDSNDNAVMRTSLCQVQSLNIPTKTSSTGPTTSSHLDAHTSYNNSTYVIFSENPEEGLSSDILTFPRSDLYDTLNDIPTEDSSISEYLSDTDISLSNLSADGSFSEELFRDISASACFQGLEASKLSLSSSGIDRLIIDESILSSNTTFQVPQRPESAFSNTSDGRPPSVLSNGSDISPFHSNPSSPLSSKTNSKLNNYAVSIMNNWYQDNRDHPYPNNSEKADMALLGGITVGQVSSWFINTRRRTRVKRKIPEEQQEVPWRKRQKCSSNNYYY